MPQDVDYEQVTREFLHRTAAQVHADPDLYERIRSGAARRKRTRGAMAALATTAMVGGACWVGVTVSGNVGIAAQRPAHSPASTIAGPLTCPRTMPDASTLPSDRPGMGTSLVPGQPHSALACTYDESWQVGAQHPTIRLTGTVPVAGTRLTALVNALREPISSYPRRCPFASTTRELFLAFGYADGGEVDVEVTLVCPSLTNGTLTGSPSSGHDLPNVITALAAPAS